MTLKSIKSDYKYEFAVIDYYVGTEGGVNIHDKTKFLIFLDYNKATCRQIEKDRDAGIYSEDEDDNDLEEGCIYSWHPGVGEILSTLGIGSEDEDSTFSGIYTKEFKTAKDIIKILKDYGWIYNRSILEDYE
jgi:hypothetical protein